MANGFILGASTSEKIQTALRRNEHQLAGSEQDLLEWLATNDNIVSVAKYSGVLLYQSRTTDYMVNLDANPFIPEGWSVKSHTKGGQFKFDPAKIDGTYLVKEQKNGGCLEGNKLRKKLKEKNPYNANLLDFYLEKPHLIPEDWKGKYIFFWGTIYRDAVGRLYVRCLRWCGKSWSWDYNCLGNVWNSDDYTAAVPRK